MCIKLDVWGVFRVADYDSDVEIWKFKMAPPKWQPFFTKFANFVTISIKLDSRGFLGRWLRFWYRNYKIQWRSALLRWLIYRVSRIRQSTWKLCIPHRSRKRFFLCNFLKFEKSFVVKSFEMNILSSSRLPFTKCSYHIGSTILNFVVITLPSWSATPKTPLEDVLGQYKV